MAQFFRLYANRVPANLFDRLRYIIQVWLVHFWWQPLRHPAAPFGLARL